MLLLGWRQTKKQLSLHLISFLIYFYFYQTFLCWVENPAEYPYPASSDICVFWSSCSSDSCNFRQGDLKHT
jgi:hypothetical protein